MKTEAPKLQFTGYPLRTLEDNVECPQMKSYLKIIKKEKKTSPSIIQKVNDPSTWDEAWFASYE